MRFLIPSVLLLIVTLTPIPARAQIPVTPEAALERLFSSPQTDPAWFDPSFLGAVPLRQVQAITDSYRQQLGAFQGVSADGTRYHARFELGSALATVRLNQDGAFSTLILSAPQYDDPRLAFASGVAALRALPGSVSLYVTKDGTALESVQPDARLAVGSAFKLAIIVALQEQIEAGRHRWDEVVTLKDEWKSLPAGVLQDWPSGSKLTLETLASQMISISDNTATDALIDIAGRDAVQRNLPGNEPLLTTRQLFMLKSPRLTSLLQRYRESNVAGKRDVLAEVDRQPSEWLSASGLSTTAMDVEWFATTRQLCQLIDRAAPLSAFRINAGGVESPQWRQVAFKGGSEPGVQNLTYHLTAQDGTEYCVATTWNDASASTDVLLEATLQVVQGLQ